MQRSPAPIRGLGSGGGDGTAEPVCIHKYAFEWVLLLDALPPGTSQTLNRHVQLRANKIFRMLSRGQGCRSRRCQEQAGTQPDVV